MTNLWSRFRKSVGHETVQWHASKCVPGVRYSVRRVSLGQRIELTHRARELAIRNDFLKAGNACDQLEASLSDLLIKRLYLEWGLIGIEGLTIDGRNANPQAIVDGAPEALADEIVESLKQELGLTAEERKNC